MGFTGDADLVQQFQSGDERAFDDLVLLYKQKVFGLCFKFFRHADEAHDMAQESFIKAYKGLNRFNREAKFSTWLYRITVNTCLNKIKSAAYRRETVLEEFHNPAGGGQPEEDLENKRLQFQIQNCVDKLSDEHRAVVVLRDVDGLPYDEVAEVLKKNLGTIKSQLARARGQMRKCLEAVL